MPSPALARIAERSRLYGLALILLIAAVTLAGAAPIFPDLTGRVVDAARLLEDRSRLALEAELEAREGRSGDQVVVATVRSLGGLSVEDYANQLFRHWKLGDAERNNGVLLLVASTERKVRIEVGYGLEGRLTDAIAGTIIRTRILPAFKAGDMPGGIRQGAAAILEFLALDPEQARRQADHAEDGDETTDMLVFILIVLVMLFILYRARKSGFRVGPPGRWPGARSGGGRESRTKGRFFGRGGSSGGGGASGGW